jgi:sec-independent protein translocase protein TatB
VFNLTGSEIVVILLLALVVLGPEKLPDAMRRFGRTYAELKKMGSGFQQEFKAAIDEPVREMRETANLLRSAAADAATDATQAVKPVSPGGPTDQRPDVRAADDPPHPDPAAAELPFADTTTAVTDTTTAVTDATEVTDAAATSEAARATAITEAAASSEAAGAGDVAEADPPARPPGPAFHSAAPPTVSGDPDLEQDGEAAAQ